MKGHAMKPRILIAAAIVVVLGATIARAHDEYRIIGTITGAEARQIQVKDRQGKTFSMKVDQGTLVMRDNKKVERAELKAGRFVVVDALGDSLDDLLAVEVRIVPALPK
jgi:lipopolysaccharide export system protein LptA